MKPFDLSLYLVLDPGLCEARGMAETTRAALAGGVTMVQLRDKTGSPERLIASGRALMQILQGSGVPLIVNDDVGAALAIGADGLHIGQGDIPVAEARARIGPDRILGLSAGTPDSVSAADPGLVDYLGIGPVFATASKPDHAPPIGMEGLARLVRLARLRTVAIGGLKEAHVAGALQAGAGGVAVVSAICGQPDPEAASRALAREIAAAREAGIRARPPLQPLPGQS